MRLKLSFAVVIVLAATPPAGAQQPPTADQLIESLRPHDNGAGALRGIKPSAVPPGFHAAPSIDAAASQPAGTAVAAKAETEAAPSVNLNIQFRTDSDELTPAASHTLDELGRALSSAALAPFHFRIIGHTDAPGGVEYNKKLSERRARTVVNYMVSRYAIDPGRLDPAGLGSADPLVRTSAAEPRNRRVQIINAGT
jgi:outer membrane protein OmpA-like peptidoglycan-associated protein